MISVSSIYMADDEGWWVNMGEIVSWKYFEDYESVMVRTTDGRSHEFTCKGDADFMQNFMRARRPDEENTVFVE